MEKIDQLTKLSNSTAFNDLFAISGKIIIGLLIFAEIILYLLYLKFDITPVLNLDNYWITIILIFTLVLAYMLGHICSLIYLAFREVIFLLMRIWNRVFKIYNPFEKIGIFVIGEAPLRTVSSEFKDKIINTVADNYGVVGNKKFWDVISISIKNTNNPKEHMNSFHISIDRGIFTNALILLIYSFYLYNLWMIIIFFLLIVFMLYIIRRREDYDFDNDVLRTYIEIQKENRNNPPVTSSQ